MLKSRSVSLAVVTTICASSCMTTKNVSLVENPSAATRPTKVEVTSRGGTYTLNDPVIRGDSLYGWTEGRRNHTVSFAISDIQRVTTQQLSTGRTAAAIGLSFVAAVGFWILLIVTSDGISPEF